MDYVFLLIAMIFCHIVDDYYLQGCLAKMKQKSWWRENHPEPLYAKDHITALFMHSFSWSFMIMLPLFIVSDFNIGWVMVLFPVNVAVHMITDNLKANRHSISLFTDQAIHIIQITATLIIFILANGI